MNERLHILDMSAQISVPSVNDWVSFVDGPRIDYLMVLRTRDAVKREMLGMHPGTRGLERNARPSQPLGF